MPRRRYASLELPCEVVTPASLQQMRREGDTYQSEPYTEEPSPPITQYDRQLLLKSYSYNEGGEHKSLPDAQA